MARNNSHTAKPADNELENLLMIAIFVIFGYMLFSFIAQYLAVIARYIYAPFIAPIYTAGESFNTLGSASVLFVYSMIAAGFWLFFLLKKKRHSITAITYTAVLLILLVVEIATGHEGSFVTAPMRMYCNPESSGLGAIFTCQNGATEIGAFGTIWVVLASIMCNLFFASGSIATLIQSMINLSKHPKSVARQRFDIDGFIRDQKDLYPHLKLYDIINPNEIDGKSGQLRLMDNSRRVAYEHDLIKNFSQRPTNSSDSYGKQFNQPINLNKLDSMPEVDEDELVPVLDQDKFETLMLSQLGRVLAGVESMNAAQIIVLGITLPRACSIDENMSEDDAEKVNKEHYRRMDYVWDWVARDIQTAHEVDIGLNAFDKLDEYRAVVEEWLQHEVAQKFAKEHFYVNTFLYRVVSEAKRVGVCQPSGFRWLKLYDRVVWALIQNIDRPSAFAENIAVVSHYLMERKTGKGINQPMLQAAYNGMVDNIQKYRFPKEKVAAWNHFKETGDKSLMRKLNMIGKGEDDDEDLIEEAQIVQ